MLFQKKLKSILRYRLIPSFTHLNITNITYKITQVSSRNKDASKKLELFSKNISIKTQKNVFQKISFDLILKGSNFFFVIFLYNQKNITIFIKKLFF